MPRSVAIIGAGQIGKCAAAAFADDWHCTLYSHSEPDRDRLLFGEFQAYRRGEVAAPIADVVVDTIAFDEDDVTLYDPDRVGRLILISSASVYCDDRGRTLDEASQNGWPEFGEPIQESRTTVSPGSQTYSTRKIRMERKAQELFGDRATIFRPSAVYGTHSKHPREWWFVKRFLDGRTQVPLLSGGASQFHTSNAEDIACAALSAAERDLGGIYNVADGYCPTLRQIGDAIAEQLYWQPEWIDVSDRRFVGRTPWSVGKPFVCDTRRLQDATGIAPSTYNPNCHDAVAWLKHLNPSDWRAAFPPLAAYPWDLFDYEAEDLFLASL